MDAHFPEDNSNRYGFASTRWTTIRACIGTDKGKQTAREQARETICREYWYPVYAYVKRLDRQGFEAEDLTQDFFAYILNKPWFERADQSRGRFRSFLLSSLDNFIRDRFDNLKAFKRGGAYQHVPLDLAKAESRYAQSVSSRVSPAEAYESEWAATIVDSAWKRLEAEYVTAGKQVEFGALKIYLTVTGQAAGYEITAKTLGFSVENVKVNVHRLRKRYGSILRQEVARTVVNPEDVGSEMRHIRDAFAEKVTAAA